MDVPKGFFLLNFGSEGQILTDAGLPRWFLSLSPCGPID
jgi:hypothetical protein